MSNKKNSNDNIIKSDSAKDETPIVNETPIEDASTSNDSTPIETTASTVETNENNTQEINTNETSDSNINQTQEVTNASEILIDNTLDAASTPPTQELDRTPKLKEPISRKKKIAIISIAIASIIVIFCAVFFPCFFFFRGKIMVSSAEDFQAESGKYFVLKKDIVVDSDLDLSNSDCSINLNGHNLTINGTLTLKTDSANTINIGTKDGNEYKTKGILTANNIIIDAENATLNLASTTIVDNINVQSAKCINISGMSILTSGKFTAATINISEAIATGSTSTEIELNNCTKANIYGIITAENLKLNGITNAIFYGNSKVNALTLSDVSTAQVYGKVDSITGGEKVAMLAGHECSAYYDIELLAIYKFYEDSPYTTSGCGKIVYIDKLDKPVDLIVSEDNGTFTAKCGGIEGFSDISYMFFLDGEKLGASSTNTYDLTKLLKGSGASTHTIEVYAIGNYDFSTLSIDSVEKDEILYINSDSISMSYSYTLQLDTPVNLLISEEDDKIVLSYDKVDFADFYTIYVDGNKATTTSEVTCDITSYVTSLGYHSIRITASSDAKELTTSKEAMTYYKHTQNLDSVTELTATCVSNGSSYTTTISFTGVENGIVYNININGSIVQISGGTTYTFSSNTSTVGYSISVSVVGYNYYNASSTATETTVIAAE